MGLTEPLTFALATFVLLATPGPTNTLVATSGAAVGFQRSLPLSAAAALGYLIATVTMALVVGPLVRASHEADIALRIACGCYLIYAAWRLWREGAAAISGDEPVPFHRVLIATSLNPKGIVFAFVVVPFLSPLRIELAWPYLAAVAVMAIGVAVSWIAVGAALRASARGAFSGGVVRRAGALVLCVFAALITGSVFTT